MRHWKSTIHVRREEHCTALQVLERRRNLEVVHVEVQTAEDDANIWIQR